MHDSLQLGEALQVGGAKRKGEEWCKMIEVVSLFGYLKNDFEYTIVIISTEDLAFFLMGFLQSFSHMSHRYFLNFIISLSSQDPGHFH